PHGPPRTAGAAPSLRPRPAPAQTRPAAPPAAAPVPPSVYQAYRATAQFITADGHTVQFSALPSAGAPGTTAAIAAIPGMRASLDAAGRAAGTDDTGIAGQDAAAYDVGHDSTTDLYLVVPLVLAVIGVLLAVLLRSLIAPVYLAASVGLSYLAALGFAAITFTHIGHDDGVLFLIPILLFVFAMALGSDYNILLMSRIREEAHTHPLRHALTRAITHTGGTITSAGLILAGTFTVLAIAGNNAQARQLGYTIAFALLLDPSFVRPPLAPPAAVLLGHYNWWPSTLSRTTAATARPVTSGDAADPVAPVTPAGTP